MKEAPNWQKSWEEFHERKEALKEFQKRYGLEKPSPWAGLEMDRREFIRFLGLSAIALIGGGGLMKLERDWAVKKEKEERLAETIMGMEELKYDTAVAFARRMDKLADKVKHGLVVDPYTDMLALTAEIAPYFVYEGIIGEYECYDIEGWKGCFQIVPEEVYPNRMRYAQIPSFRHFHVGGMAVCDKDVIYINNRYMNPFSSWYGKSTVIAVITHELGHIQGICGAEQHTQKNIETATQIATFEVLAAMANHGNPLAVYPLLVELREAAMDFAHLRAIWNKNSDGFYEVRRELANNPLEIAHFEKSRRYWRYRTTDLTEILKKYGAAPFELIYKAFEEKPYRIKGLPVPNETGIIQLDDLAYFLKHTEEIVDYLVSEQVLPKELKERGVEVEKPYE